MADKDLSFNTEVTSYQRYLLMLHKLMADGRQKELEKFFMYLVEQSVIDKSASVQELYNLDFELIDPRHMDRLFRKAPQAAKALTADIQGVDVHTLLAGAGYGPDDLDRLGEPFVENVRIMARYEDIFLSDDPSRQSLVSRLANARASLLSAVTSDRGQLIISSIMFSIAVASGGGAGLALSGASLLSKVAANPRAAAVIDNIQSKLTHFLVKMGVRKDRIVEKDEMLSARLAKITQHKAFKVASIGSLALLGGVGLTAVITSDSAASAMATVKSVVGGMLNDGIAGAKDGLHQFGSAAAEQFVSAQYVSSSAVASLGESRAGDFIAEITAKADAVVSSAAEIASAQGAELSAKITEVGRHASQLVEGGMDSAFPQPEHVEPEFIFTDSDAPSEAVPLPVESTVHYVEAGETLWGIVREHFLVNAGAAPTDAQIIAMINDINIADPNAIAVSQEIILPGDVHSYAAVSHVEPSSWLQVAAPETNVPVVATGPAPQLDIAAAAGVMSYDAATMGSIYQLDGLAKTLAVALGNEAPTQDFIDAIKTNLIQGNPGIDNGVITPGKEVILTLHGGGSATAVELVVPSIKEHVFHTVVGTTSEANGIVDTSKVYSAFKDANPDFDFRRGILGIPTPGSAADLVERMIDHGAFNVPEVDVAAMMPQSNAVVLNGLYSEDMDVYRDILRQAYPDGIPDLVDERALVRAIAEMNPELANVSSVGSDYHFNNVALQFPEEMMAHQPKNLVAGISATTGDLGR